MELLVLILNKTECMPGILCRLMEAGVSGTTIVDCQGMLKVLGQPGIDPPPIFGSLRQFLNPERKENKMLLTVLKTEHVSAVKKIIDEAVGGIDVPGTGIMFTISLSSVEGLASK